VDRRAFLSGATLSLFAPLAAEAQPAKIPKIGVLRIGSPADAERDSFRQALHELGYAEGQNIVLEYRWAERLVHLPDLAADLVRLKVDVIVTRGVAGVRAAKQATSTIPIVMEATTDPLGAGLIASLARPGGNVTGSATLQSELGAKRLELFMEAFPSPSRVAVLYDPTTSARPGARRLLVAPSPATPLPADAASPPGVAAPAA
jgi:putative ABC transport system substrate-binding protein